MKRTDVKNARDTAARFVEACDELLAMPHRRYDHETGKYADEKWSETWIIAGKATGAHRRLSLDLTRALAHMRRRT